MRNFISVLAVQIALQVALQVVTPSLSFAQNGEDLIGSPVPSTAPTPLPHMTLLGSDTSKAPTPLQSAAQNLSFGGALEILVVAPIQNGNPDSDRARVRTFELTGQTLFDALPNGVATKVTLGGFDNAGDLEIGLREGFAQTSISKFDIRVGKYFLPIGLFNQTRHSAWITPSAPRVITRFFGNDGIVDTGLDLVWHAAPIFRLRGGVMNGYTYGPGLTSAGIKPRTPTHYLRPTFDFAVSNDRVVTISGNYVGRMDDEGTFTKISGADFTLLPRLEEKRSWFMQGELFNRELKKSGFAAETNLGGTIYYEKGLTNTFAAGLRADAISITSLKRVDGSKWSNLDWALAPVVSFYAGNEFKFQAAYTYLKENRSGDSARTEQTLEFRLVTELGRISKVRGLPGDRSSL